VSAEFLPLRTRPLPNGEALCVSDTGQFFAGSAGFLGRLAYQALSDEDWDALKSEGVAIAEKDELGAGAYGYGVAERLTPPGLLDYLILVPTLRCNLSCSYCQVSRAGVKQPGFDWTDETLVAVLKMLDGLPTHRIKVEFQGGEPTLRPDLIRAVMERCARFAERQFVICTNLQELSPDILDLFDRDDVYISTSLDGDAVTHDRNRTGRPASAGGKGATGAFFDNLSFVLDRYGPRKVSALPTIDAGAPPDIDDLIESYAGRGLNSIFLRPINYQGFARKRHAASRQQGEAWRDYHRAFVRNIIVRNWQDRSRVLEESYFSICLRRVFQPGRDRYVDLRNPNPMGLDYIVVDHDGQVYPTDEARMLSRAGVIDLAIGDVEQGWATPARDALNFHATNQFDPACQRCAYQPFCGRDLVDDLSRYGRVDMPRTETDFCRRHLSIFDFIFELIYEDDPAVHYSLSRWLRLPGTPHALGMRLA
jgi:His-Xaa-Ser system radical SAM maturase HxsB